MNVALVYDRVNKIGGAERILMALHEIWPEASLYTSVYNSKTAPWAKIFPKIYTSFLQNFPFASTHHELYASFMPLAFESFNFDGYDVVISVTSEAAKGIITGPKTLHICYCLTPTRYLWSHYSDYFKNELFKFMSQPAIYYLRQWDKIAAQRPDYYVAISENVKKRIKDYYNCDSEVIYPPVDLDKWTANEQEEQKDYFLIVSRLVPYKRIDIAIETFNNLGLPLKIVGTGSQMGRLRALAKSNIEFLGELTDADLLQYYQGCRALIFTGEEDLGLTPVEAQACGKPIIAFRGGGATETIIEGKTGEFFYPQTANALLGVLKKFDRTKYRNEDLLKNVERFSFQRFENEFMNFVSQKFANFAGRNKK